MSVFRHHIYCHLCEASTRHDTTLCSCGKKNTRWKPLVATSKVLGLVILLHESLHAHPLHRASLPVVPGACASPVSPGYLLVLTLQWMHRCSFSWTFPPPPTSYISLFLLSVLFPSLSSLPRTFLLNWSQMELNQSWFCFIYWIILGFLSVIITSTWNSLSGSKAAFSFTDRMLCVRVVGLLQYKARLPEMAFLLPRFSSSPPNSFQGFVYLFLPHLGWLRSKQCGGCGPGRQ